MSVLLALALVISVGSGLLARVLVPGARQQPVGRTLVIGAAGTMAAGLLAWFVVTPLTHYLSEPGAVTLTVVGSLLVLAAWRTGGAQDCRDTVDGEHRRHFAGWTSDPRYS